MESLTYLALIWLSVYLSILLADRTRLTPVLYFLAMGSVMVNIGLFPTESDHFIESFAEIGIIVIMFALGFEESTSNFIKSIKRAWGIAVFGALGPFAAAFSITYFLWNDINIAIMCGLAMAATTVSLSMVSLKSEGLHRTALAKGIMTSAVVDNASSLVLIAIMVPLATGDEMITLLGVGIILLKVIIFFGIVAGLAAWVLPRNKFGFKQVLSFQKGEHTTLAVLLLALLAALLAHAFGFHAAVGAYMAGLIIREDFFQFHDHPQVNYYKRTKTVVDNIAFSWIGPVFFVVLGTKIIFDWDIFVSVIPHTMALFAGLFVAQVFSAGMAARYIGKFTREESIMIGFGMLGRAELAFVVMGIAYIDHDILSTEAFYTLMFTAFWLNVAVPIAVKFWKPYLKMAKGG
jgi:Kef-type K+ transport system membrane component KefB